MEIKQIQNRFGKIKMLNSAAIFVLSFMLVFYLYQFFTIIPAFSHQITTIFYTGTIRFDNTTSALSADVWTDADNIMAIFGTAPVVVIIFTLLNLLVLTEFGLRLNESLRIFCYWNIINGIVRVLGNFIFGHIFFLWSSNLITDFLEISFPNAFGKILCVLAAVIVALLCIWATFGLIKYLFNPLLGYIRDKSLYNIALPSLIGVAYLALFFLIPHFNPNELGIFAMILGCVLFIYALVIRKYKHIPPKRNILAVKLNLPLIIFLLALFLVKIITDRGVLIYASLYRNYLTELFLVIGFGLLGLIALIAVAYHLYKRRKQKKKMLEEAKKIFEENNGETDEAFWGVEKHDMSKYKDTL
ncbi:MAG: hypothetical protein LBL74_02005 [Bacteroidales bacterium]|jgi:cbb3-type cytochrome oxidase subunit 3|nr:hypothetical protein [Bacteroidales bacterium]